MRDVRRGIARFPATAALLGPPARALAWVLLLAATLLPSTASAVNNRARRPMTPKTPTATSAYEATFRQFAALSADPTRMARVRGITLRRDVGTIQLDDGTLAFCKPINGRVWGAVFVGTGRFSFRPPTTIEREQLERFYQVDSLTVPLAGMVLLFADGTEQELSAELQIAPGTPPPAAPKLIEACLNLFIDQKTLDFTDEALAKTLLEDQSNGAFVAYVDPAKGAKTVVFGINPYRTEQVRLWRPVKEQFFQGKIHNREIICQFPLAAELAAGAIELSDRIPSYEEEEIRVDARFDKGLNFSAESETKFRSLEDVQRWISFGLAPEVDVDSVLWENGRSANFYKGDEASLLWVRCDSTLAMGDERTIRIRYHGDIVERRGDWVYLDPTTAWYPRHDSEERTGFDLTYRYPDTYQLASVGDPVSTEAKNGFVTSHWTVPQPIRWASFMIGVFKDYKIVNPQIPPVTILYAEAAHKSTRSQTQTALTEEGYAPGKAMEKQVGADVANSLGFFQKTYGPTPLKQFYAAENPIASSGLLGVAFPGLIHLDAGTFYSTESQGSDEMLRAHEVAHQWWGASGVNPATYHDLWLSEAFAEFSALCYLQAVSKNNERYFDALKKSSDQILHDRKFMLGNGQEAGPIWLGSRNETSSTERDYPIVVYGKGAWVLEMLRNLFLDLDTMKDDGFGAIMREFYSTYASKNATTEDFERIVEKHAGRDMSWFFNEWVYGTGIPSYRFAYKVTPTPDGKFKITCRVDQENVPEDFQMFVPIHLDFGNDQYSKVRVFVKGRHSEFDLPLVPVQPIHVVFNDLQSVLCEVENVKW